MKKGAYSKYVILIVVLICAWYAKNLKKWENNGIIKEDVNSYYAYLPASLIFHDLNFDFVKTLPKDFEGKIWLQNVPNGNPILRMTMGLSILWIPFFYLAHATAHLVGASTLGYSWPYHFFILIAALTYLSLGLIFLRKILINYFSEFETSVVIGLIVLATNLMHYVIAEPGMSHVYNFTLITVLIYYSLKWNEKPELGNSVILGIVSGLIILIRPVNIIVLIFPLLIGITSLKDIFEKLINNWKHIVIAAILAFLVFLPQMLYWKMQTGHFLFNSYMDQGKFYWGNPQFINGLFSYRKGWLVYTPVMSFSIIGLIFLYKKAKETVLPIVVFTVLSLYVTFSFWCWWYGGSFGMRPLIDFYGIMAIPMAAFIHKIVQSKIWLKVLVSVVIVFLVYLNQFQMTQYRTSLLHWDSMTKKAYWSIMFEKQWPQNYDKLIKVPDYDKAVKGENEY